MAKKRAFISFDYDHDEGAKIMLAGQAKHEGSPFDFKDASIKEPLTGDWKAKIRRRMDNIDVVIVLCGESTHTATGVAAEVEIMLKPAEVRQYAVPAPALRPCLLPFLIIIGCPAQRHHGHHGTSAAHQTSLRIADRRRVRRQPPMHLQAGPEVRRIEERRWEGVDHVVGLAPRRGIGARLQQQH